MSDIGLFDAIHAQRAVRRFRPDPIPQEAVERILESATHAPSGGNAQSWSFIVVRDQPLKDVLAVWYQDVWENIYTKGRSAAAGPVWESAKHLAYNFAKSPVVIIPCIKGSPDEKMTKGASIYPAVQDLNSRVTPDSLTRGASIYPAVQNMMLAALALGIGSVITTFLQHYEDDVKALLGIPDNFRMACAVPMGYPAQGEHFGGARRKPLSEVVHYERWGNRQP